MFKTTRQVEPPILRHQAIGTITRESVATAYSGWINHAEFDPFIPILWDCRNQSLQVTAKELINRKRPAITVS